MINPSVFEDGNDSFVIFNSSPVKGNPIINIRKAFLYIDLEKKRIEKTDSWFNRGRFLYELASKNLIGAEITYDISTKEILGEELTPIPFKSKVNPTSRIKLDPTQKIWRYLNVQKLSHLLKSKTLYLSRIDRFKDNLEGISSQSCRNIIENECGYDLDKQKQQILLMEERFKDNRKSTFTSCWHINDALDLQMWNEYSRSGFCIETNYSSLETSLLKAKIPLHFEPIRYFQEPYFNQEIYWFPTLFKRNEFQHERELRISSYGYNPDNLEYLPPFIDLQKLIKTIHVHPNCSNYNLKLIKKIASDQGLKLSFKKFQNS